MLFRPSAAVMNLSGERERFFTTYSYPSHILFLNMVWIGLGLLGRCSFRGHAGPLSSPAASGKQSESVTWYIGITRGAFTLGLRH